MYSFETDQAAKAFTSARIDTPIVDRIDLPSQGMVLHAFSRELDEGIFTNVYDLSFAAQSVNPSIELQDKLTSVFDFVNTTPGVRAATGGGFFFLADQASSAPRQLGLNLAYVDGQMRGFPVADQEAVLVKEGLLSAEHIRALGIMSVNGTELSWSGSRTPHETDIKVFASGNSIITHVQNDATGSMRVLDESSRYTPGIDSDSSVDIGFIRRDDGTFVGVSTSESGGIDIFGHDVVLRMHERHARQELPEMRVLTIGSMAIDGPWQGAISVGPMLDEIDFANHPVNNDKSLGGKPPFLDIPLARTALYETESGIVHLRLFDGRPGSSIFPGVTPAQASRVIKEEDKIKWGCFLDPGQTAKLAVRQNNEIASYGNSHYLKWPKHPGEKFIWTPKTGRPVATMIALR